MPLEEDTDWHILHDHQVAQQCRSEASESDREHWDDSDQSENDYQPDVDDESLNDLEAEELKKTLHSEVCNSYQHLTFKFTNATFRTLVGQITKWRLLKTMCNRSAYYFNEPLSEC